MIREGRDVKRGEGGGGQKVIASRSDKLICNEMHSFCMTAGETHSEAIEMEAGLVTADKEDYHPQRMCPTLTRHRSVQLTRQQKAWRSALLGSIADDHKAEEHVLNFETALL